MLKNSTDPELIRAADLSTSPLARELALRWARDIQRLNKTKQLIKQIERVFTNGPTRIS